MLLLSLTSRRCILNRFVDRRDIHVYITIQSLKYQKCSVDKIKEFKSHKRITSIILSTPGLTYRPYMARYVEPTRKGPLSRVTNKNWPVKQSYHFVVKTNI